MNEHLRVKHIRFKCETCQFGTHNTSVLSEHMRDTHRTYKCSLCVFTSSSYKGLKCKYCGADWEYEDYLKTHIRKYPETN